MKKWACKARHRRTGVGGLALDESLLDDEMAELGMLPSAKPRCSNVWRRSSSMPGLPHSMMRSVSMSSGGRPMSWNNCSDVVRSVMRPRLRNGSEAV